MTQRILSTWILHQYPVEIRNLRAPFARVTSTATSMSVLGLPMTTKTLTRPQQRQIRSWQNLTDRRKLRHLENTLDKAITQALHQGGIESHEDFKAYVESFSEQAGKAPITVELCEGGGNDDEIRGYRFYLTNDPNQRTSGKYLIKNLEGVTDKDETYFTPSNIAEMFGFAEAELDELDTDRETALDLDTDFAEELDDELEAPPVAIKSRTKTSNKTQYKTSSKTQAQGKPGRSNGQNFRYRDPIEEASRLSATAAVTGRETTGVNLAGLTGQLATLGIVVGQGLLEDLAAQDDAARIERIVRELQRQNDQVDTLTSRLQESTTGPTQVEPASIEPDNPLANAAATVGSKVDRLGVKLDSTYKSQPLELDRDASISEQLDQIETYLKGLAKRLDRLEVVVSRLEQQIVAQTHSEPESSQSESPEPPIVQQRADPQQAACAEALVGFARVADEFADDANPSGIVISNTKTLRIHEEGNQIAIALNNHQGHTLFAGNCTDGEWAIATDHLNPEEKASLSKLPQSTAEYAIKASAQALVAAFQEQMPEYFNGSAEPVFTWPDEGKAKYEFEVVTLPDRTQLLQGFDLNHQDEQVFDAILVPGQAPDIRHCRIPIRDLEAAIQSTERSTDQQSAQRSGKNIAKPSREELQV
jgi:hypothetical protein